MAGYRETSTRAIHGRTDLPHSLIPTEVETSDQPVRVRKQPPKLSQPPVLAIGRASTQFVVRPTPQKTPTPP